MNHVGGLKMPVNSTTKNNTVAMKQYKKASVYNQLDYYFTETDQGELIEVPVQSVEDVMESSTLLKRMLPLKKYQGIINQLKDAASDSAKGIVNFVTGADTGSPILTEGILKSAFPPGSRIVYKGEEGGYGIDASSWGDQAAGIFNKYMEGEQERFDETEYQSLLKSIMKMVSPRIEGVQLDFTKPDAILIAEIERKSPSDPKDLAAKTTKLQKQISKARQDARDHFNDHLRLAHTTTTQNGSRTNPYVDASDLFLLPFKPQQTAAPDLDAGFGGGIAAPPPRNVYVDTLRSIEKIRELGNSKARYYKIVKDVSTDSKTKAVALNQIRNLSDEIASIKATLPEWRALHDNRRTDRTGFAYYKPYDFDIQEAKILKMIDYSNMEKLSKEVPNKVAESEKEEFYVRGIEATVQQVGEEIEMSVPGAPVSKAITAFLAFLKKPLPKGQTRFGMIREKRKEFNSLLDQILVEMKKAMDHDEGVMIISNADRSALIRQPSTRDEQGKTIVGFNKALHTFSHDKYRQSRSIVFVTASPLSFDQFQKDEITVVELDQPVDMEEADELTRLVKDKAVEKLEKEGIQDPENLFAFEKKDRFNLQNLLVGKSHTYARSLLSQEFGKALSKIRRGDTANEKISGSKFVDSLRETINSKIIGGQPTGIVNAKAGMDFDDYIFDPDTEWGAQIDDWMAKFAEIESLYHQQESLEKELDKISGDPEKSAQCDRLSDLIIQFENKITGTFQSIPVFMLLKGLPGVGKTVFVQAFAKRLGFGFAKVDMGEASGEHAGETEKYMKNFFTSLYSLRNTILLWDEIDKNISGDKSAQLNYWENRRNASLLQAMDDDKFHTTLRRNRVFIIGTANNPENMNKAITNRAKIFTVPSPYTAVNYKLYLERFDNIIRRHRDVPEYVGSANNPKEAWDRVADMMKKIDLQQLANAFVGKGVNFRKMEEWVMDAVGAAVQYQNSLIYKEEFDKCKFDTAGRPHDLVAFENFKRIYHGYLAVDKDGNRSYVAQKMFPKVRGFPFTTECLVWAAEHTKGQSGERESDVGTLDPNGVTLLRQMYEQKGFGWTGLQPENSPVSGGLQQQDLPFDLPPEPKDPFETEVLTPVSRPSQTVNVKPNPPSPQGSQRQRVEPTPTPKPVTSTDHYLNALKKAGLLKE